MYDVKGLLQSKAVLSGLIGVALMLNQKFQIVPQEVLSEPLNYNLIFASLVSSIWGRIVAKTKIKGLL